jgi:hypothetical protein
VFRHVVRLAAATIAVAAAGVVVPAPAQASICSTASGVSVVVDFHQLGGGVQTACDSGGAGKYADQQFADAGHTLTYVQGEAFVCQVDSKPASQCAHTPPADAYWSLWWSDGKSGEWKYASVGVTQLKVPNGGYVALSWQGQSSQAKPRVTPTAHSSPSPTAHPSSHPTSHPSSPPSSGAHQSASPGQAPSSSAASGAPGAGPTSGADPSSKGTQRKGGGQHHQAKPSKDQTKSKAVSGTDSTQSGEPVAGVASAGPGDSGGSDSAGLPGWVAPAAIAVLFAGSGAIVLARRGRSGGA